MVPFSRLLAALADVPDPRRAQGKRYPLPYPLMFTVLALLSGARSYRDDDATQERLLTALNLVGRDVTAFVTELGLEHGANPLRLDVRHLTVVADTDDGPLALAQMGSGENWVGYHVAAHLGCVDGIPDMHT